MKIKVCGMRDPDNIRQVAELPIHYMGFIFYEQSPRYVGASTLADWTCPESLHRVGVFVNASEEEIMLRVKQLGLTAVQLHGSESPELASSLKQKHLEVFKVFSIADKSDLQKTARYEDCCDYFLFDTQTPLHGGSGKSFDWNVLSEYKGNRPFFLSGGIGTEDTERLLQFKHPQWAGIDLNSRFELSPGYKNAALLSAFINQLKTILNEQNQSFI